LRCSLRRWYPGGPAESERLAARAGVGRVERARVYYMVAAGFFYADRVWVLALVVGGLA